MLEGADVQGLDQIGLSQEAAELVQIRSPEDLDGSIAGLSHGLGQMLFSDAGENAGADSEGAVEEPGNLSPSLGRVPLVAPASSWMNQHPYRGPADGTWRGQTEGNLLTVEVDR